MRRFLTIRNILILLVLVGIGWWIYKTYFTTSTTTQYRTETVARQTVISSVSGSGSIKSTSATPITTKASGMVTKVYVTDGEQVKATQPIALLSLDMSGKQQYTQSSSSYQSAKIALENAQSSLYSLNSTMWSANQKFINDAVSRGLATNDPTYIQQSSDWLSAESKYKTQQQSIAQSQTALSNAYLTYLASSPTIYAPISGKITGLSIVEGMVLTTGTSATQIGNIVNSSAPLVSISVSEIDIPHITQGNKVTVTVDALDSKSFAAKVISVDTVGSSTSGVTSYPILMQFETAAADVLPNMSATVSIVTDVKDNVIAVPVSSIVSSNNQTAVRVMNSDGSITNRPVELGISSGDYTQVLSGISEGENVVTSVVSSSSTTTQSVFSSPFSSRGGVRIAR